MSDARLEVTDALGQRTVTIDKTSFKIGRRDSNDLRLAGSEVSRDHAEIVARRAASSSCATVGRATARSSTAKR